MPKYTQDNSPLAAVTPLGKDVLLVESMSATERIGRMFRFDVTFVSEDPSIDFSKIVGENVTIKVQQPDKKTRFFNGYVSRFVQVSAAGELCQYQATLVPWLWFLTRTADCRIFQQKKVPDIITEVCKDAGFTDVKESLNGSYRDWDYCVQYRETAFNFISRLMEQEGIYYYFEHTEGKHKLVLADSLSAHKPYPGYSEIPYRHEGLGERLEHITGWTLQQKVQPGVYTLRDFDFEAPSNDLTEKRRNPQKHAHADREIYDYPGEYTTNGDGKTYAGIRLEELHAGYEVASGRSNVFGLRPGYLFTLKDYPRGDQCCEHLVTQTSLHVNSAEFSTTAAGTDRQFLQCEFSGIKSSQQYRSERATPKPLVHGPQTAIVVGKKGEEIWTDKHGRVKVQFHWDRDGKKDENSSCWVRVSQGWAGKKWGHIDIPRMGQEVIVDFLEGDPDRPIITGRVYNEEQKPPYALPDNATQSGIKTRSTKKGDDKTFNELRFEDKKGEEEIYFHAEKDFNRVVENNDTLKVGFDDKDKGDQTIEIYNDRTTTLDQGNDKLVIKKGNRTVQIDKGDDSLKIKMGDRTTKLDMGASMTEAMKKIVLKVGQNSITIDQKGITVKGMQITIQGQIKTDVKSPMTTVNGDAMLTLKGGLTKIN